MFREMRRSAQYLSEAECEEILKNGTDGVLSVSGDDGYPYGVPLNYLWYNGKIYFHCAKKGHKIDAIMSDDKVSFCVVDKHRVLPEIYATEFTSVIVFGRARILTDAAEMHELVQILALKFCPGDEKGVLAETNREMPALAMIEITPEHITGKMAKNMLEK